MALTYRVYPYLIIPEKFFLLVHGAQQTSLLALANLLRCHLGLQILTLLIFVEFRVYSCLLHLSEHPSYYTCLNTLRELQLLTLRFLVFLASD
jgi:hypothetical protein